MSDLLKRLDNLSPEKRELVLQKLRQKEPISKSDTDSLASRIVPVSRERALPLSVAQQRVWFLDQLEGESTAYNMPAALRLTGTLNVAALEQALREIVRRHEVLRTTFRLVNGSPVQVIDATPSVSLPIVDLQALPEEEQLAEVQQLANKEAQKSFDLAKGPLLRTTLLQLGQESHVLLVTMHHIISDGWSIAVFIRELSILYQAFCDGKPSPLTELTIQYADFASWQRQWLSGEVLATQLDYWKQQLAGASPLLELPTDRPRPPVQTFRGSTESFELNRELTQKLKALSQQVGATLFMTLLAAFATLLFRYSGQKDILMGSPIANRRRKEIESLIGFFLNTLVLRIPLEAHLTFSDLLRRVRQIALDAYAYQDIPFEHLAETLQPERNLSYSPWFQVLFVLQNMPREKLALPGLTLSAWEIENLTAKFDLSLYMEERESRLSGSWEYNTDLFDRATIRRLSGHFQTLLEEIVSDPEQTVAQLPLLSEAEQHQLLVEWSNTQAEAYQPKCIHQLFEEQVERTPDAIAVEFSGTRLTYRELNNRANQLARSLQTLGVGAEALVGLYMERSLEMVVGLLGILKAGGAYVPLDATYPKERLAYILSDAKVSVLLTQERLANNWLEKGLPVVCLDTGWSAIAQESGANLMSSSQPENLAYVIYTSGSTGNPKGVMIEHQSLVNFTEAAIVEYEMTQGDRLLQFASISFDTAAEEIYSCLSCGATLVLRTDEILASLAGFLEKCRDWKLTVLDLPTAYWQQLTAELTTTDLKFPETLRLVIIGGERVLPASLSIWQAYVGHTPKLVNGYGPTEATVVATIYELPADSPMPKSLIGCPIRNVQTYVLDRYLQPVPLGVPGELHIGGLGLARGYLNRPDLTEKQFIPNPFREANPRGNSLLPTSERLYKTGDLVRYLPDGNLEYLGRIDNQVKIRGFRIELGEIEAILGQHPWVRETAVMAREDVPGDKYLVAYVVPYPIPKRETQNELSVGQGSLIKSLRHYLAEKLPDYMIPSVFVLLEAMPLTPNGKVDRRALPVPDESQRRIEDFVPPRDPLELQLAQIWEEVLGVHPVGVQDNFFDLGGNSLLAIRLMAQMQQFSRNLPLATLFQSPTIERLASLLRQQAGSSPCSSLVTIQPSGSQRSLFCVHPGGGNVLCYFDLSRELGSDQPFYGLQSVGLNGEAEPYTDVKDMAAHYINELRTVQSHGPYLLVGWSFGGLVAFEMAQQLQAQGQQVAFLGLLDTYEPSVAPEEPRDDAALLAIMFAGLLTLSVEHLRQLNPDEQLLHVIEQGKKANFLPPDYGLEQARYFIRVYKCNQQAERMYVPQPYAGRISLFAASEDVLATPQDPTMGWSKLAAQVEIHPISGTHQTMVQTPHVSVLAKALKSALVTEAPCFSASHSLLNR